MKRIFILPIIALLWISLWTWNNNVCVKRDFETSVKVNGSRDVTFLGDVLSSFPITKMVGDHSKVHFDILTAIEDDLMERISSISRQHPFSYTEFENRLEQNFPVYYGNYDFTDKSVDGVCMGCPHSRYVEVDALVGKGEYVVYMEREEFFIDPDSLLAKGEVYDRKVNYKLGVYHNISNKRIGSLGQFASVKLKSLK